MCPLCFSIIAPTQRPLATSPQCLTFPTHPNTVSGPMFDTTTSMVVGAKYFDQPVLPGLESFNLTTKEFLIENERLGKKVVFDLGCSLALGVD